MKLSSLLLPLCLSTTINCVFVGMGAPYSQPYCAYACRAVISSANLTCTTMSAGMSMVMMMTPKTTADCRAGDEPFLTSLAYCIKSKCPDVPVGQIEKYWVDQSSGDPAVPPKWNYATALEQVNGTPNTTWAMGRTLNLAMLVPQPNWNLQNKFLQTMDHNSNTLYKYSQVS
jgi:hypothetical protein